MCVSTGVFSFIQRYTIFVTERKRNTYNPE